MYLFEKDAEAGPFKENVNIFSDEYLRGENQLDDHVIHLLFSSNRWEKSDELLKTLVRFFPLKALA